MIAEKTIIYGKAIPGSSIAAASIQADETLVFFQSEDKEIVFFRGDKMTRTGKYGPERCAITGWMGSEWNGVKQEWVECPTFTFATDYGTLEEWKLDRLGSWVKQDHPPLKIAPKTRICLHPNGGIVGQLASNPLKISWTDDHDLQRKKKEKWHVICTLPPVTDAA